MYIHSITVTYSSVSYEDYIAKCCTQLGSINGSVNLTTSSTETSVSVSVLTEGVNAYGDANNVSGYEFKLYTASAGGDAAASYSSNSKAGTSHTFSDLTPLTNYWVTVRPIGDGSTYCNTTAESDRVQIATTCVAPNHVDISGRWDRFGGETISLTSTAYSSAGTSSPIDAEDITGYQWQKLISSTWTDVSDGTTDGVTTSGATTNNLQISNCKLNNSGKYRCIISTGATCSTASATATDGTEGFDVKVYVLECYTGGTTVYNFTRVGDTQAGTAQITLAAGSHTFKFHADNIYYGNNGTINEDVANWVCSTSQGNLSIAAGLGGTFTINMEYSTGGSSSVEGEPEISVTYPRKTIYLTPGVWNTGGAKFAFYYFRKVGETIYGEGFTDFITADDCGSYADIPQWNGVKINAVRLNSNTTASDLTNSANHYKAAWDKKWNQTSDITISSNNSITITDWGDSDSPYTYGNYAVPTYTISYAKGSTTYTGGNTISGSKDSETKTCGVDFTLPGSAVFSATGYTQTGWKTSDGGSKTHNLGGDYTTNAAQAFYPAWTANTHELTWSANGGDALTGDYTYGTVAYGTAITAPNTPTRTGYRFDGWHNGTSIVTPATTMPDNDLTYTAQWSLATYTVTLNTNSGTINSGNVTSYTYGTGATLPTDVTRDGYRFDGWFANSYCTGDAVTSISSSATGDKEYWAKWTAVYTVAWSVNGETWSSGVVEGNTHVPGGSKVSALPTAPTKSDCDDAKVFVGWRSTAIDGVSAANLGSIFTTQAASPAITGDVTFYAVFADESGGDFTRVTSTSQLVAGQKIIMGYEATANSGIIIPVQSNTYNSDKNILYTGTTEGSGGSGTLTLSSMSAGDETIYAYTLRAGYNIGYWAFEMSGDNAGKYLSHRGATNGKNSITSAESITSDGMTDFSIVVGTDDVATITNKWGNENTSKDGSNNYNYMILSYNYNSGTPRAAIYRSTQTGNFVIYICNPLVYSNYVTTCASCDADATFTNTTPAVSAIDCDAATLTATGGLATLGADGCNISDYGFVIGTSADPAIGGVGVTKLQVGTTNPALGADFTQNATGLTKGTHYYVRAYATNRHGTAYSDSQNFWTKGVSSIAITTAPTKTNYIAGEVFDKTGMAVTATMAGGGTETVTDDITCSSAALTAGVNQNFAINYSLCGDNVSTNQKINVYAMTVTEGTAADKGVVTYTSGATFSIGSLATHWTANIVVTNGTANDNGDGTYTVTPSGAGAVSVTVNYVEAAQVKVYYKVDGVTVTGLTQDVYQSETTTLPSASDLATAMSSQDMDIPDDSYPNFVGWSETEFGAQTSEPTLVTGTPTINAEKTYYAVYSNLNRITIIPSDFSIGYPSPGSSDGTKTIGGKRFGWNYLLNGNVSKTNLPLQFKSNATEYGRLYNTDALSNILRIEIGYYDGTSNVPVYAASAAGTISGNALTPASRESTDPYVYTMPASTSYFYIKGDNSTVYKIRSVDIYYASATVEYMTQFCTRYDITGVTKSGTAVTGGTLTSNYNSACEGKEVKITADVSSGYRFDGWTVSSGGSPVARKAGSAEIEDGKPVYIFTMPAAAVSVSATITRLYTVTYAAGSGVATGDMSSYNGSYAEGETVTVAENEYERCGHYFNGWRATDAESGAVDISSGSFSMPASNVTITAQWASYQDTYKDMMHTTYFRTESGNYTTKSNPNDSDTTPDSSEGCEGLHYHFMGWVAEEFINTDGTLQTDAEGFEIVPANKAGHCATGTTYYAVWAEEVE